MIQRHLFDRALWFFGAVMLMGMLWYAPSQSQYLDIDEGGTAEKKEAPAKTGKSLPSFIARNVKASALPNVRGAVRITWDTAPESDDSFIVGRTTEVPYSSDKAISAVSIKLVEPGAERVAIDSNLPPGQYYYVVLAKEKVMDKDVELYPNVNYTSAPVIIEREAPQAMVKTLPEKVTLIYAMIVNKNRVLLTWKGAQSPGLKYTIYRGTESLKTPDRIKNAEKIALVDPPKESFVDKGITRTGTYYYAITTKDSSGSEDLQLIPDQSYTATGVFVALQAQSLVSNLKAELTDDNSVRLKWDGAQTAGEGQFLIYRDVQPITSPERIALSDKIGSVAIDKTTYVDAGLAKGSYYYAVLGKLSDGTVDTTLARDVNYTSRPVVIGGRLQITSIRASLREGGVRIDWAYRGKHGPKDYKLIRTQSSIQSPGEVGDADTIGTVNILTGHHIDRNPPAGGYYYALIPADRGLWESYRLSAGVNITARIAVAEEERKVQAERIEEPQAPPSNIDAILRATFFQGRYDLAIMSLRRALAATADARDAAKARLFIGRSYIEKREFRRALDYILTREVRRHFPREADFWSRYAISQIK